MDAKNPLGENITVGEFNCFLLNEYIGHVIKKCNINITLLTC